MIVASSGATRSALDAFYRGAGRYHTFSGISKHVIGAIGADGYWRFWVTDPESEAGEKMWRAHRYAATLTFGSDEVESAEMVTHLCDNPLCVRAETGPESHLIPRRPL